MKVVFVASGNKKFGVSSFVASQFESLKAEGLEMILYPVKGKGWRGYANAIKQLRRLVKQEKPDIIHAHYSICGHVAFLASLFTKTKVVVSILGSFPEKNFKFRLVRFCINHLWDKTIVKSRRTAEQLGIDMPVIPNGVNLEMFQLIEWQDARRQCGFEEGKKYVIWCSNPNRQEKDYPLAQRTVEKLDDSNVVLFPVFDKSHEEVVKYMCAADVLMLTSQKEGSPNVIKEAMSCNCPIVSTDVGDVKWVTEGVEGTYVADEHNAEALESCLKMALLFGQRTCGRKRITDAGLTTKAVAFRIIELYNSCR